MKKSLTGENLVNLKLKKVTQEKNKKNSLLNFKWVNQWQKILNNILLWIYQF